MQLTFKNTGSTIAFINWLKGFKDINTTILFEVDLTDKKFVAKCFPDERNIVKYSEIDFETAGYEISELLNTEGESLLTKTGKLTAKYANEFTGDSRIKIGIYEILNKLVEVANTYVDVEHTLTIHFDISKNVKYVQAPTAMEQWQSEEVVFTSKSLSMTVRCSQLTEFFRFLSDNVMLNNICNLKDSVNFSVTPETMSNLARISLLFNNDKQRTNVKLYAKKEDNTYALYAYDESSKSYDYLLGYMVGEDVNEVSWDDIVIFILRENLINATKAFNDTMTFGLSSTDKARIVVTSGKSKVVIASYQNH